MSQLLKMLGAGADMADLIQYLNGNLNPSQLAKLTTSPSGGVAIADSAGNKYAAFPLDAVGNASGNLNLRTDTLANLLALAGGISEIGYDPVTKSLVLFNGVAGQAVASGRNRVLGSAVCPISSTTTNAVATTYTPVTFNNAAAALDDGTIINPLATTELLLPAGANAMRIQGFLNFAASAAGTQLKFRMEYYDTSVPGWVSTGAPSVVISNPGTYAVAPSVNMLGKFNATTTKVRLTVAASDGVGLAVTTGNTNPLQIDAMVL